MHQVTKVPEKLLSFAVRCKNLTVSNTQTVLLTPEIYISQNVYEQLLDLLLEAFSGARRFLIEPNVFFFYLILFVCSYFVCCFLWLSFASNFLLILCISEPEEVIEYVEEGIAGLFTDQEVRTFEEVIVPVFDIFQGRIKDLDLDGIDAAFLYPSVGLFSGAIDDPGLAAAMCRAYNKWSWSLSRAF